MILGGRHQGKARVVQSCVFSKGSNYESSHSLGIPAAGLVLAVIYLGISYLIASGVTKAERKQQEDHPTAYGLQFEDVEFVSRTGDVNLSGWYIPGPTVGPMLIFVQGIRGPAPLTTP